MEKEKIWEVNEIEVTYSQGKETFESIAISNSDQVEQILRKHWSSNIEVQEEFVVLLLSRANQIKGFYRASKGGVSSTVVDAKIIFSIALKSLSSGIILAHNHPSGRMYPGNSDISLTKKLVKGGKMLDIDILDHIILHPHSGFFSFRDEGML